MADTPDHAALAALDARVNGLERAIQDIASTLGSLNAKMDERGRTPWAIVISAVSLSWMVMGGLGYSFLQPLKEGIADNRAEIRLLNTAIVPRSEHERVWVGYDEKISDVRRTLEVAITNLQRQTDDIKEAQGAVYGTRDIIQDLKESQRRLEEELARIQGQRSTR